MTIPWPEPDPAILEALGRVAWAAAVMDSCILRTCRNLSARVNRRGNSTRAWMDEARAVLDRSNQEPAQTVRAWLEGVYRALDKRHEVLHAHPSESEWLNGDDPPVPGRVVLINAHRNSVTFLSPRELDAVARDLLASLKGWESIHGMARAVRVADEAGA